MSDREILTFSVEGMTVRDELLFKSFVRLLSHRTDQQWLYKPQGTNASPTEKASLRVIGELLSARVAASDQPTLRLGVIEKHEDAYLCLPIRAKELEIQLNRLGHGIVTSRNEALLSKTSIPGWAGVNDGNTRSASLRLLRWPPASVLNTPARVRMATLMIGQPVTLEALERRSAQSRTTCEEFVAELQKAGLVKGQPNAELSTAPDVRVQAPAVLGGGLLSRIRSRFGLQ